jgi:hypothetical protein
MTFTSVLATQRRTSSDYHLLQVWQALLAGEGQVSR